MKTVQTPTQTPNHTTLPPNVLRTIASKAPTEFLTVNSTTSQSALQARRTYVAEMKKKFLELSTVIAHWLKVYNGGTSRAKLEFLSENTSNRGTLSYDTNPDPTLRVSMNYSRSSKGCLMVKRHDYTNTYVFQGVQCVTGKVIYPYL